ncbi:hypothetical protein RSSM_04349 [Rhodopirellula sallentina SM41]|uniref:Uncharacterized protein n=1 Tax=Rhodopirellula sallentina SM41 TaxID=1263870 RepID=M5TYB6_9BACT|nr:hypothetical protein RSSM_04349 [Rhodopirellula sallentina SM41]
MYQPAALRFADKSFNGQPKAIYLPLRVAYGYRLNENATTRCFIERYCG